MQKWKQLKTWQKTTSIIIILIIIGSISNYFDEQANKSIIVEETYYFKGNIISEVVPKKLLKEAQQAKEAWTETVFLGEDKTLSKNKIVVGEDIKAGRYEIKVLGTDFGKLDFNDTILYDGAILIKSDSPNTCYIAKGCSMATYYNSIDIITLNNTDTLYLENMWIDNNLKLRFIPKTEVIEHKAVAAIDEVWSNEIPAQYEQIETTEKIEYKIKDKQYTCYKNNEIINCKELSKYDVLNNKIKSDKSYK